MSSPLIRFGLPVVLVFFCLVLLYFSVASSPPGPYDRSADAEQEIQEKLAQLGPGQKLLLMFGANWCPDCRKLEQQMSQAELAQFVDENFSVVYVDVGQFDHNTELVERYGRPSAGGIPALVVLGADGEIDRLVKGPDLAKVRRQGQASVQRLLTLAVND